MYILNPEISPTSSYPSSAPAPPAVCLYVCLFILRVSDSVVCLYCRKSVTVVVVSCTIWIRVQNARHRRDRRI